MFTKARIKLTLWYLLIIMLISISFSFAIYRILSTELIRLERVQRQRLERRINPPTSSIASRQPAIDPEVIEETENRLRVILLLINLGIFGGAGIAGYFLAGRTLKPIKDMLDEQAIFVTNASHELRTPLTSLKSEIEVGLRDKEITLTDAKKLLQSNLEEVNNLQYLSDNLIKLTQHQKYNGEAFEEIDLAEVIISAQKKVSNLAKHKNITIKNRVTRTKVFGERESLIELFVILLDNAIKYSNTGKMVTLYSHKTDGLLQIDVKDQGIGIDEKNIPHLFDRFYRADKSRTKSETLGYGLGLSIAKEIIERHHGYIRVESKVGRGTTFKLSLRLDK